jgi:DNA-binding transcriptional MerR regulator
VVAQLQSIAGMERAIARGNPAALVAMRGEIAAAALSSAAMVQQVRDSSGEQSQAAALANVSSESRQQVQSLMRDMHQFDPYLRFSSPEDEAAYRRREAERQAYIAREQARGTPDGNLNASAGAIGQMVDAKAHGAGDSPEFRQRWNELVDTTARLRDEVRRSGGSTREFDARLREDLRRILHARGVSDAEVDARFASHPDALEAVREYMNSDADLRQLRGLARDAIQETLPAIVASEAPAQTQTMSEAIARLRAAGVTAAADHPVAQEYAHGVAINDRPVSAGPSLPG